MILEERLKMISLKVAQLRAKDVALQVFGSGKHNYEFNPALSELEIANFEWLHDVKLPLEYREFIKHVGNGGAGPFYGLEPLWNGLFMDLDYRRESDIIDLSEPFPHTTKWNLDFAKAIQAGEEAYFELKDNQYYQGKWSNGMLRISNMGCGISANLIVNGSEYGSIWIDDRCNDQGIYPLKKSSSGNGISFLDWYEAWLKENDFEKYN